MLESKGLDENIWDEAMNVDAYIQNSSSQYYMKVKSPFKSYFEHKPDVSNFKVFRSDA